MTAPTELAEIAGKLTEAHFDARGNSNYTPAFPGRHLCGIALGGDGHEQPYTAWWLPIGSDAEARTLWSIARAAAEVPSRDEEDFLVDLNIADGCIDDFSTNRQMLPRMFAALRQHLQGNGGEG